MSTSDAVHSELSVRGETATPPHGETRSTRSSTTKQWDDKSPHPCCRAVTHERRVEECQFGAEGPRQEVNVESGSRYTTRIVLRLSNSLDLKRKQDSCVYSSDETQRCETVAGSAQVDHWTSLLDSSREVTSESPLPQKIQFLSGSRLPSGLQPSTSVRGSTEINQLIKDGAELENQTDVEELGKVMLSSAMVTVLAPTWTGRLRRSKRFDATGSLETLTSLPGMANSEAIRPQSCSQSSQSSTGRLFNVSQAQSRAPFLNTRQNTTGWSSKSGPQNLDYELKSKVPRTASLDGSAKEIEMKKAQASTSWDPYGQKGTQRDGHPLRHSSLSSKPTTSSLLLSLRRLNNQSMNSNNPTSSEVKPAPLKTEQDVFSTQVTQAFHKTLERERFKPLPSSLSLSPRAAEMQPVSPPSLPNHGKRGTAKTSLFLSSTLNKITTDTPKQPQLMNTPQPSLSCLRQEFISQRPSDNEQSWISSGRGLNLFPDSAVSSHKSVQYDSGRLSESGSPSRNTPVTSSSRWQQNSQGNSPPVLTDTPKTKSNTPLIPLSNNNRDTPAPSRTPNKSLNGQISDISSKKATSICNDGVNLATKPPRGGIGRVKEKQWDDSFDKMRLAKQLHESSLKKLETQKSQRLQTGSIKRDVVHGSFKPHVSELAPSLKPSSFDRADSLRNQVGPSKNICAFSQNQNSSPSFQSKADSSDTSLYIGSRTSKVPNTASNTSPLGFIRSYSTNSKSFQTKDVSSRVPMINDSSRQNPQSMSTTSPIQITSTITSHLQTPPATPTSPNRKVGGILTNQSEKDNKKTGHGKRVKHVMWEDSENSQSSKSLDPSVLTSPLSRSRSQSLGRAPSVFSFLRSSSQNTKNAPLSTASRKTSDLQYRSLSSDSPDQILREQGDSKQNLVDNPRSFERMDVTPCRLQRSRSLQADEFLYYTTALSSPDYSNGYKIRYSSPPYSTLISSRGETKKVTPRTPLFPNLNSNYTSNHSLHSHPVADATSPISKTSLGNSPKQLASPLQNKMSSHENLLYGEEINNNSHKSICRNKQTGRVLFIESRVDVSPQTPQSLKMDIPGSDPKAESSALFAKTLTSEQSHTTLTHSNPSSSGSSSVESRCAGDEVGGKRMKESVMGKFKLFSAESNNEQNPKKRRFVMKKSTENEKANKTSTKMDQVINKLRQTFSPKRPEDEQLPWKWRRASETPSVAGLTDTSDATLESSRTGEDRELKPKDDERPTQNRYTLIPTLSVQNPMTENEFFVWPDQSEPQKLSDQIDVKNRTSTQFHLSVDPSPSRSPKLTGTNVRKSSPSSKSPFSPFSSLSTHSPFPSPEVVDDSVFYSPKMPRRRESSSPCEPGEGISLVSSRRSRASTGPPSTGPIQDDASCYADLKYGIEPGRSVSVSSVLSSRRSGPGRISTGPKFMSVDDLSETVPTYGGGDEDFNQWLERNCNHRAIRQMQSHMPSDGGKARSRSLPRSLTRRLAQWSSGVSVCPPADTAAMSPNHWSPKMKTSHFDWDTVSPPTPPPTPPLSPQPRRMSKPPSLSSPNLSSPSPEPMDSPSPRGHLPSRGYVSHLTTFEESSDSSSDTTTDDEYYLENSDDDEKETEL
ncbi:mucin-3B isoform X1 [Syngnathus typhle]|uniref:mucin-3B isoform X1 n=2 Tax=Syngnathus typhle TaxID=161592 RepID=UPI002A6A53AA|nr:mucin-3B isoform X1 [Syngnathus typhle]